MKVKYMLERHVYLCTVRVHVQEKCLIACTCWTFCTWGHPKWTKQLYLCFFCTFWVSQNDSWNASCAAVMCHWYVSKIYFFFTHLYIICMFLHIKIICNIHVSMMFHHHWVMDSIYEVAAYIFIKWTTQNLFSFI